MSAVAAMGQQRAEQVIGGRYRVLQPLGRGGTATVYRAWDTTLEVERALKILSGSLAPGSSLARRFHQEARTMARLQHPHILVVSDAGLDEDRPWMIMELLHGGSLRDRLDQEGPLALGEAVSATVALLAALQHAHDLGVIHRDVKPANVLLDEQGVIKLADFGLAQVAQRTTALTRTGAVMGTFAYMAPEQRTDASRVGPRTDVYGATCTLFALLTGAEPFDLCVPEATEGAFANLPGSLVEVLRRGASYKMEDRYASAAEMSAALQQAYGRVSGGFLPALVLPITPSMPPRAAASAVDGTLDVSAAPSDGDHAEGGSETYSLEDADPVPVTRSRWPGRGVLGGGLIGVLLALGAGFLAVPGTTAAVDAALADAPAREARPAPEAAAEDLIPAPVPREGRSAGSTRAAVAAAPVAPKVEASAPAAPAARPVAAATATVRIGSLPYATVRVDGQAVGVTPWVGELAVGSRRVVLRTQDGQSKPVTLTVGNLGAELCWDFSADAACGP